MRTLIIGLVLLLAAAVFIQARPQAGEIVRVQVNKEVRAPKSRLTIRFTELVEDSRCPKGTNCVWAGEGKIKVLVSRNGGKGQVFELSTMERSNTASFVGYQLRLVDLKPQPAANVRINRTSYMASIEIKKAGR